MVTMKIEAAALAEVMKTAKRVCRKSRYNEIAVINNIDSAEFVITDGVEMYVYRFPAQFDREEGNMCLPVFDVPKLGSTAIEFEGETVTVHPSVGYTGYEVSRDSKGNLVPISEDGDAYPYEKYVTEKSVKVAVMDSGQYYNTDLYNS